MTSFLASRMEPEYILYTTFGDFKMYVCKTVLLPCTFLWFKLEVDLFKLPAFFHFLFGIWVSIHEIMNRREESTFNSAVISGMELFSDFLSEKR